jgi:hypothetical protein
MFCHPMAAVVKIKRSRWPMVSFDCHTPRYDFEFATLLNEWSRPGRTNAKGERRPCPRRLEREHWECAFSRKWTGAKSPFPVRLSPAAENRTKPKDQVNHPVPATISCESTDLLATNLSRVNLKFLAN